MIRFIFYKEEAGCKRENELKGGKNRKKKSN